jgi:hypothetical protein
MPRDLLMLGRAGPTKADRPLEYREEVAETGSSRDAFQRPPGAWSAEAAGSPGLTTEESALLPHESVPHAPVRTAVVLGLCRLFNQGPLARNAAS